LLFGQDDDPEPDDLPGRRHPRNPWVGFAFGFGCLIAAGVGVVLLLLAVVEAWPMPGGRNAPGVGGWVIFAPIALALASAVLLRRAVRAVGPWRAYLTSTSPAQRRTDRALDLRSSSPTALWLGGGAAGAGLAVVAATFAASRSGPMHAPAGIVVVLESSILLFMLSAGCLGLAFRIVRSRRDLPPPR
jgi:hypothetical protein